jgi:hypothetical protein
MVVQTENYEFQWRITNVLDRFLRWTCRYIQFHAYSISIHNLIVFHLEPVALHTGHLAELLG